MCELLAVSSRIPTRVTVTLETFAQHGGGSGPHRDGWGIAYYDGRDVRLVREAEAAASSAVLRCVEQHPPPSTTVISHIRLAKRGRLTLANTQPFVRELGGRTHVFAHNGLLEGVETLVRGVPHVRPIGETDSEIAFCVLLERLRPLWHAAGTGVPPLHERFAVVEELAAELRPLGPANFLYSDSHTVFAHGHRRTQGPGRIEPPGLHLLERACDCDPDAVAASGVGLDRGADAEQQLTLVASVPLSDEGWRPFSEGELIALEEGVVSLSSGRRAPVPTPR